MAKGDNTQWVDLPLLLDWTLVDAANTASSICSYRSSIQATLDSVVLQTQTYKQRLYNYLPFKVGDQIRLRAREGIISAIGFDKGATVTLPRGIYYAPIAQMVVEFWNTILYTTLANDVYTSTTGMGAATGGPGNICEGTDSSENNYVFCSTQTQSVSVSSGGVHTTITDVDFPANTTSTPVFLDGYVFVAQNETRNIYNSAAGDQTSWSASAFIRAEEASGDIVALKKHHRHIVAFCRNRIEFFKDAGIAAPNSPLQRVSEYTRLIGSPNRATIVEHGDIIYFVGMNNMGGEIGVYKLDNFQIEKISNVSLDSFLRIYAGVLRELGVGQNWNQASSVNGVIFMTAYMIELQGKSYYCLCSNAGRTTGSLDHTPTLIYDPEFKIWIEIGNVTNSGANYVCGGWSFPYGAPIHKDDATQGAYTFLLQHAYGGATGDTNIQTLSNASWNAEVALTGGGTTSGSKSFVCVIDFPRTDFGTASLKSITGVSYDIYAPRVSGTTLPYADSTTFADPIRNEFRILSSGINQTNGATLLTQGVRLDLDDDVVPAHLDQYQVRRQTLGKWRSLQSSLYLAPTSTAGTFLINSVKLRVTVHDEP